MPEAPPVQPVTFADAAHGVIRRLWMRKSSQWIQRSAPFAIAALMLLVGLRWLGAAWCGLGLACGLTLFWLAACFAIAWWRKPEPYAAYAFWDAQASRRDAFANAWWFESQARELRTGGQEYHLRAQLQMLPAALVLLRRDVALPDLRRLIPVPVILIALALIPGRTGLQLPDAKLTDEGRRLAEREGHRLEGRKLDSEKLMELNSEEKQALEKLQQKIAETAKSLGRQEAGTAREVLSELETHARAAENLAEKLGAGSDAWASDQMIAELRKHADTAELGDAVANRSTENTAKEAEKLAGQLRDEGLPGETRDRLAESLSEIGKQAQPEDKERTVGQHVIAADKDMAQALAKDAGVEFQKLADKMKSLAAREKAREELEKLAQQLRDSGSNIAGEGGQGMQQLSGNQGQGQSGQSGQGQMLPMENAPQTQPMQTLGFSNAPAGQGKGGTQKLQMFQAPDGEGKDGKEGKGLAPAPADAKTGEKPDDKNDKPMLFAPVPGQPPDQPPTAAILMAGPNAGGAPPGTGTAKMGNDPAKAGKAARQGVVNGQRNAEGESSVRAIEGGAHPEQSKRSSQAETLEAIKVEENALDDVALPAARREQVRRYFTELRKRFEKEP